MCAPKWWNTHITNLFVSNGFSQLRSDKTIFVKFDEGNKLKVVVGIYVDDCQIAGTRSACDEVLSLLRSAYEIEGGEEMSFHLGMVVTHDKPNGLMYMSQQQLIDDYIVRFGDVHPVDLPMKQHLEAVPPGTKPFDLSVPYKAIVGGLMHIQRCTRPDISFAVSSLAVYLDKYQESHWKAALKVLGYLKKTKHLVLVLGNIPRRYFPTDALPSIPHSGKLSVIAMPITPEILPGVLVALTLYSITAVSFHGPANL